MEPIALPSNKSDLTHGYYLRKRLVDFIVALCLLIALAPLFALIAILIKLDSPGPVIFLQKRAGSRRSMVDGHVHWDVCPFHVYKFRTMRHSADDALHRAQAAAYIRGDSSLGAQKIENDPRITRIGKLLRRTSLDELPQLMNVLRGDMSLVGPRPVPMYEFDAYQPWQRARLAGLPGITGYWQVTGRGRVSCDAQIRMDIEYLEKQSLWFDLKLLILTIPAVLLGRGAK